MTILIGTWSANETHCDGDDCWTHSGSRGGVVLAWAHNPLGPGDFSLTQPLP